MHPIAGRSESSGRPVFGSWAAVRSDLGTCGETPSSSMRQQLVSGCGVLGPGLGRAHVRGLDGSARHGA